MTREITKELLSIIKAYSEGKQVQYFNGKYWEDRKYLNFDSEPHRYRIKPEIKYRPFKSVNDKSCCSNHYAKDIIGECFTVFRRDREDVCFQLIKE